VLFMSALGFAAAGTVAIAVLLAITLVPALLGFAGPRALKGKCAERAGTDSSPTMGMRWVGFVTRHRLSAIGLVTVATLALALPVLHLRLGLPDDASKSPGTPQRTAGDLLTEGFGEGFNGQLTIVAELPQGADGKATAATIGTRLAKLDDVASVASAQLTPDGDLAIITVGA
jgi:RND superfamily putative drug exporter